MAGHESWEPGAHATACRELHTEESVLSWGLSWSEPFPLVSVSIAEFLLVFVVVCFAFFVQFRLFLLKGSLFLSFTLAGSGVVNQVNFTDPTSSQNSPVRRTVLMMASSERDAGRNCYRTARHISCGDVRFSNLLGLNS